MSLAAAIKAELHSISIRRPCGPSMVRMPPATALRLRLRLGLAGSGCPITFSVWSRARPADASESPTGEIIPSAACTSPRKLDVTRSLPLRRPVEKGVYRQSAAVCTRMSDHASYVRVPAHCSPAPELQIGVARLYEYIPTEPHALWSLAESCARAAGVRRSDAHDIIEIPDMAQYIYLARRV